MTHSSDDSCPNAVYTLPTVSGELLANDPAKLSCFLSSREAIDYYEQQIAANPETLAHYWYLGLAWLLQGEVIEAQGVWFAAVGAVGAEQVESEIGELRQLLWSVAAAQMQAQAFEQAECLYGQILELEPPQAEVFYRLGNAIAQQGRYEEAIESWQQAIDQVMLLKHPLQKHPLQAEAEQTNLLKLMAEAYCQQGLVWQTLGQLPEAIAAYEQAIQMRSDWQTHERLGWCWGQQGDWSRAAQHYQLAIQVDPFQSSVYADLGWALWQLGQQEAIAYFHQAVYQRSHFARMYQIWAEALQPVSWPVERNAAFLKRLKQPSVAGLEELSQLLKRVSSEPLPISSGISLGTSSGTVESAPVMRPSGWVETTRIWIETQPTNGSYSPLDPPTLMALKPPKTIDDEIHFSFRFGPAVQLPETFVVQIPQGQFWLSPDQTSSAILTEDHQLLFDLSPEFPLLSPGHPDKQLSQHTLLRGQQVSPLQKIEGHVAVLSGLTNDMYFHWMFDVLPRWELLCRSGWDETTLDGIIVSDRLPFQQETLRCLGIPSAKIHSTDRHLYCQAQHLIVPSYPGSPAWMPEWVCNWLRKTFLPASSQGTRRLYISRHQTANRRLINEAEVMDLLQTYGFECVVLETYSVLEQAALLAEAEVVISPHGGGLTNLVFCRPGTKVIELFSPHYVYPCYWLVSNLVGLDYSYLLGKTPEGFYLHQLFYPDSRTEDILIDRHELEHLLRNL